jgi:hypothetical protein
MRVETYTVPITGTGVADYTHEITATIPVNVAVQPSVGDVDRGVADDTSEVNRLDDSSKDWAVNIWAGSYVRIIGGTGVGQARRIDSNTATGIVPVNVFTTAPDGTSEYMVYPSEADATLVGLPIFRIRRQTIVAMVWTELVRWDIPAGSTGDLGEISLMSDIDAKTRYRVTIAGVDQNVPNEQLSSPFRIPWATGNVLAAGTAVVVEVMSTDGTGVTVDGLITGTER